MRRVSVVGVSGSGKTTLGRRLAAAMGVPFVELDSFVHQPGWNELTGDPLRARVAAATGGDGWVVDGNYEQVRDLVWKRADTVVWLDLPRRVVMRRVILRTIRRTVTREELWNGNREPLSNFYRWDPARNIIRWTWVTYPQRTAQYAEMLADPPRPGLGFLRLASDRDAAELLRRVGGGPRAHGGPGGDGGQRCRGGSIIEIREVGPDDWQAWRSIRLAALAEAPGAFTTALADWHGTGDTERRWRDRLVSVPFNVVADRGGRTAGMVSAVPDEARGAVELLSLWVTPEARGSGVGDALVDAVADWARSRGAGSLVLRVIEGNEAAERLYRRHGFRRVVGASGAAGQEVEMQRTL